MVEFMLPVQYLRQIAEQLRVMGVAPQQWLAHSQLDLARLDEPGFQPDFALFQQLILDALELTGEPALGLLVGERLVVNSHGILGFAALQSETLRQALTLVQRYLALRTTLVSLEQRQDEAAQQSHIHFVPNYPLGDTERTLLEAVMLAIKNVFDAITLGGAQPRSVSFACAAPAYVELTQEMFGCEVHYAQGWSGFTLDSALLDVPLKMADPEAFREAEQICQRELAKLSEKASMSARVRRVMLEKQHGFPSLNVAARLFHMTPRTLHRRLLEEGTSFKQILEEVRHTLAVEHLKGGRLSVEDIAYSLGYTDLANFRRAFKRWEGVPPSVYRERLAAH